MIETRTCRQCNKDLPLNQFAKDASRKGGYRTQCLVCHAAKQKEYRKRNPGRYRETVKKFNERKQNGEVTSRAFNPDGSYDYKKNFIDNSKSEGGCVKCGENDPCCLSFHHLNPNEKKFRIADFTARTLDELVVEMAKCVVLCENCHRKLHNNRFSL